MSIQSIDIFIGIIAIVLVTLGWLIVLLKEDKRKLELDICQLGNELHTLRSSHDNKRVVKLNNEIIRLQRKNRGLEVDIKGLLNEK